MIPGQGGRPRKDAFVFYKACWLTKKEVEYNNSLTPADDVKAGNAEMVDKISGSFRPLLRPNSEYKIELETSDTLSGGASKSYPRKYSIAFRTAGPVGHFHEFPVGNSIEKHPKWVKDRFTLEKLAHYVDMQRSYPAADGNLVGAKPLYYSDPDLRLYFTKPYVERFFMDWAGIGGSPDIKSSLELEIIDPGTNPNPPVWEEPEPATAGTASASTGRLDGVLHAMVTNITFEVDPQPVVPRDVRMLANIIELGPDCGGQLATPEVPGSFVRAEAENLRPRALYTASWRANFEGRTTEVHQYQFQTSRYASHEEQVHSYLQLPPPIETPAEAQPEESASERPRLPVGEMTAVVGTVDFAEVPIDSSAQGASNPQKSQALPPKVPERQPPTVYRRVLDKEVTAGAIADVASGNTPDTIRQQYATAYDQLLHGVLGIHSLPACERTDFTAIVREVETPKSPMLPDVHSPEVDPQVETVALLVRNPEPFLDPRIPEDTRELAVGAPGLTSIVAPDTGRALLISSTGEPLPRGDIDVAFEFWCFASSGLERVSADTVAVAIPGRAPEISVAASIDNRAVAGTSRAQVGEPSTSNDHDRDPN